MDIDFSKEIKRKFKPEHLEKYKQDIQDYIDSDIPPKLQRYLHTSYTDPNEHKFHMFPNTVPQVINSAVSKLLIKLPEDSEFIYNHPFGTMFLNYHTPEENIEHVKKHL